MTKKNGGNVPPVKDDRVKLIPIGCGNCMECRKQKARGWQIRLLEEVKERNNGKFITLTFSNESIAELAKEIKGLSGYNLDNAIATLGMRRFLERWRKKFKVSIRHFMITELGHKGTENIHMHGIMWTDKSIEDIRERWGYGYMYPRNDIEKRQNYVTARTVNYIIKYITKRDEKHTTYQSKILTSAGIGSKYIKTHNAKNNKYNGKDTDEGYRTDTGHKMSLPIYYRNAIYSEEQREQLWIHKLDKEVRWVKGEKIDISKGYEDYDKAVAHYRKINHELGYGGEKDENYYERRRYELERRKLMMKQRIEDPYGSKRKSKERREALEEYFGTKNIMKHTE